jgi:hypothetical protein
MSVFFCVFLFLKGLDEKYFFVNEVHFETLLKVMGFTNVFENG